MEEYQVVSINLTMVFNLQLLNFEDHFIVNMVDVCLDFLKQEIQVDLFISEFLKQDINLEAFNIFDLKFMDFINLKQEGQDFYFHNNQAYAAQEGLNFKDSDFSIIDFLLINLL